MLKLAGGLSGRKIVTLEEDLKVVRIGNSPRVAIPAVSCKALGIVEGDTVHLETIDHQILLRKLGQKKRG